MRARPIALTMAVAAIVSACTAEPDPVTTRTASPGSPSPIERSPRKRKPVISEYRVPLDRPHDVAPARDGRVWYTAQGEAALGLLNPNTGRSERIPLGDGSSPHGVIVGPDGDAWVTDSGLNAIVRVDAETLEVSTFPLPGTYANLNTATFDGHGVLWFTGQNGIYGRLRPEGRMVEVFDAPGGPGPYGIATTPRGQVWYASLAGSAIGRVYADGRADEIDVPTPGGGARRIWSDSHGRLWVTEWYAGKLARYDPRTRAWREWTLPGTNPQPYAVYVDENDYVWVTDFGSNALVGFDPRTRRFNRITFPSPNAEVRQLLGRPDEVWGAESGTTKLMVLRTPETR